MPRSRTLSALPAAPADARAAGRDPGARGRDHALRLRRRRRARLVPAADNGAGRGAAGGAGILSGALGRPSWSCAIAAGDRALRSARAPGVGPKLAARLAGELRDKAGALSQPVSLAEGLPGTGRHAERHRRGRAFGAWSISAIGGRRRRRRSIARNRRLGDDAELDRPDPRQPARARAMSGRKSRGSPAAEPESEDRTVSSTRAPEDAGEASLRPQTLADFVGQEGSRREPRDLHRGRPAAGRGAGPRAAARPAGPRQDHAGADRGARAGRGLPRHLRPGDPARPATSPRS